ncbi:MAG: hypothetical protein Q9169_000300 [Polycauliona sp. 2 TL-2023]
MAPTLDDDMFYLLVAENEAASLSLLLAHIAILTPTARSKHHGSRLFPNEGDSDNDHARGILSHQDQQTLVAVRKMTGTEAEMFFQDYWHFDLSAPTQSEEPPSNAITVPNSLTNASTPLLLQPPLALHRIADLPPSNGHWARALLQPQLRRRDFQCPTGTNACDAIDRPDSCCPSGNACQLVRDKGLGDVACCPSGQTCTGDVQDCAGGYQTCPGAAGGGCCVLGYDCVGTNLQLSPGAHSSTTTVIVNPQVTASPSTSSSSPSAPQIANPVISTSQTTITTSTTSTSTTSPSSTSSSSSSPPIPTSTNNAFIPPARPTSAEVVTTHYLSASPPSCPTGFYQCSAYYHGGCCRVGRDCGLTDCPTSASTTVAVNDGEGGVTVVAPSATGAAALGTGNCASGWQTCARDVGGGCCPGGFACGVESCTKDAGAKVTGAGEGAISVGKGEGQDVVSGGCRGLERWGGGGMVVVITAAAVVAFRVVSF